MTNKVSSFTTEKEQKRLTLSTRLALGASRFSDEVVEYLMQNEHQDEIQEILGAVVCLGKDQRFALLKAAEQGFLGSPLMNIPSEWAQAGEKLWKTEYGITTDFAGLKIPQTPLNTTLPHIFLPMCEKVAQSAEFFFQSDKQAYGGKVWKFTDKSLDEVEMTHKHIGTFGFWLANVQEAPDECLGKGTSNPINLHTAAVRELEWVTTPVPLRQLFGRAYWREYGVHPDQTVVTFCADSYLSGGDVPCVLFDRCGGIVCVSRFGVQRAYDFVRFRRAVVPSNLQPSSLPH